MCAYFSSACLTQQGALFVSKASKQSQLAEALWPDQSCCLYLTETKYTLTNVFVLSLKIGEAVPP